MSDLLNWSSAVAVWKEASKDVDDAEYFSDDPASRAVVTLAGVVANDRASGNWEPFIR